MGNKRETIDKKLNVTRDLVGGKMEGMQMRSTGKVSNF